MTEAGVTDTRNTIEDILAQELARGDCVLGTLAPMLGMLFASQDSALFSDEIVARVRGMTGSVARQMLVAQALAEGAEDPFEAARAHEAGLAEALAADLALLAHCQALAIEHQLAIHLEVRSAIDPVLSPLLQALVADKRPQTASLAMALLAAQARFVQQQRRMELPLGELPRALFERAVIAWDRHVPDGRRNAFEQARMRLEGERDARSSRRDLLSKLVASLDRGPKPALSLAHAGVALFLSALAQETGQERDVVAVATNESQIGRLALMLRSTGLKSETVSEQFLLIHPEITLPEEFAALHADRAAALLASSARTELG